ncbi:hypothetical protein WJX72_008295 [[Myrmecia] bisecta]|uniref:Ubiquitin-like domain-containing protein n=1 Tax=[Myrmecia] bisecta TaxID=41462 RepID=A0AAW1QBW6_9CHLO
MRETTVCINAKITVQELKLAFAAEASEPLARVQQLMCGGVCLRDDWKVADLKGFKSAMKVNEPAMFIVHRNYTGGTPA